MTTAALCILIVGCKGNVTPPDAGEDASFEDAFDDASDDAPLDGDDVGADVSDVGAPDAGDGAGPGPCYRDPRFERTDPTGAVRYVDRGHAGCDNGGPGTEGEPWCAIQAAADNVGPDTLVVVKEGVYEERVTIRASGNSSQQILFLAEPTHTVEMRGFDIRGDRVRVEGFRIKMHGSAFVDDHALVASGSHVEVVGNDIREVHKIAITTSGDGNYIAGNTLYQVQMGINASGDGWLVEHNEVERLYDYGGLGDCDYSRFFGTNGTMRANFFHGTDRAETGSAHIDCHQTFDVNGDSASYMTFEGNVCWVFSQGIMAEAGQLDASSHWMVRNNVYYGDGAAWGLDIHDVDHVLAYNNTFVNIQWYGIGLRSSAENGVIKNNIFYNVGQSYFVDQPSNHGDYNLIFDSSDPDPVGPNDIIGEDPKFVDLTGKDFHLQPDSFARDRGEDLPNDVTQDLECTPRPQGDKWDIGAYEYK